MSCPCGSTKLLEKCCAPFLSGEALPDTAEQLMRSRYTAFTQANLDYIKKTLAPEARKGFDAAETKKWATEAKWKKLTIHSAEEGTAADSKGIVEFSAFYEIEGQDVQHHETARFRKEKDGQWLFIDGDTCTHGADEDVKQAHSKPATVVRKTEKIGRNDPCSCGSGKKFKKCCDA